MRVDRIRLLSPEEIHGNKALIARVIATLYAAGAILVILSVLLPHPAASNTGAILGLAGLAAAVSASLFAYADRVSSLLAQLLIGLGTVLICLCLYFAHQPGVYGAMFVWVILVSAFFFPGRRAAAQLAFLIAAYAVVLYLVPHAGYSPLTRLALTALAFGTAAAVVSWLSLGSIRRVEASRSEARTDPLTGVANRRWLDQELGRELAWAQRHGTPLALAIIDLDDLKSFNDEHGHLAGDRMLVSAVRSWQKVIRPSDFLSRVGGDEFTLVMPDCTAVTATAVLSRIRAAMPESACCSSGIAVWDGVESALDLFQRADSALYAAKRGGGDQTVAVAPVDGGEAVTAPG